MALLFRMALLVTLLLGAQVQTKDCGKCKCTKYPVERECVDCCGVARGNVKAVTQETVTVSLSGGGEETFHVTSDTVIKGKPEANVSVLVVYSQKTKDLGFVAFGKAAEE